jgi:mannose-6-phosphate isomerase
MTGKIFALQAYTQNYDWGKLGSASKAAAYARVATPGFEVDEEKPYAEVGSHPRLWTISLRRFRIFSTAN